MNTYKVVVAAVNAAGSPDFFFCKVNCLPADYNEGIHYEIAKQAAKENGYEKPMVAFDELDAPCPGHDFFSLFVWDSASLYF